MAPVNDERPFMSTLQKWEFCDLFDDGTTPFYGGSEGGHRVDYKSKGFLADATEHQEKGLLH